MATTNNITVSKILDPVRKHVSSPLVLAGGIGLLGAGMGVGLWDNIIYTGGSLGRYPIRKITGMSDDEYDQAMDELASDNKYRAVVPMAIGALLGGTYLASRYNVNQAGKGLTSWLPKAASLHKEADELFSYGGYVPDINFNQIINANQAKNLFTNDPNLRDDPYVKNMGVSIINSAANKAGYVNPTLGNIYDSTVDKVKSKLSWQGVSGIAANTMLANATAHLFTAGLGAISNLSPEAQRKIVDTVTWATFAKSIFT